MTAVHKTSVGWSAHKVLFGFCACGWTGPWRRWEWLARWDARKHFRFNPSDPEGLGFGPGDYR